MIQQDHDDGLQLGPDPDRLYRYHRQQLSAMLDGELSPDQARFMLRRLQHDTELAQCWERWQVCGDVLRGRHHALLPADFAARVAAGIDGDVPQIGQAPPVPVQRPRLLRWGGGAALAASVAVAALFVARQPELSPVPAPTDQPAVAAADTAAPAPDAGLTPPTAAPTAAEDTAGAAAAAIAGGAVLLADASRGEVRRSRGQQQRAASTRVQRQQAAVAQAAVAGPERVVPAAQAAAPAAAAVSTPSLAMLPTAPAVGTADPYAMLSGAGSRPWPRAGLTGGQQYGVGLGEVDTTGAAAAFYPPLEPSILLDGAVLGAWTVPSRVTAIGAQTVATPGSGVADTP